MKLKLGLRSKVLALSSLLLLLPWFAYQFVNEMENFLRLGQQQTLLGTTSAIATALHERPSLFNEHASFLPNVKKGHDLYVFDLTDSIKLDGHNDDWENMSGLKNTYPDLDATLSNTAQAQNSIRFHQLLGKKEGYLYAHFEVFDQHPVKRDINNEKVTENDHLLIAMSNPQGVLKRYIISATNDGWFNAYEYPQNSIYAKHLKREKSIQGFWQSTAQGYNIEFRMPLTLLNDKLGFQLNTVSNQSTGQVDNVIQTSNLLDINKLGSVLLPSPEIENILLAMSHTRSRLWVVDRHQRVIAKAGDIHQATGVWPADLALENRPSSIWSTYWQRIEKNLLSPIYDLLLEKPDNTFTDTNKNTNQLNYQLIDQALTGTAVTQWRLNDDKKVSILSAAHPIIVGKKVMGAVVAEETNHGILILRNQALQTMFNILLAVIFIAGILLFAFLSTVVNRILKLRDQSQSIIDENGRLSGSFEVSHHSDEIGDLSRGIGSMLKLLGQYHHYIEQLSSRLSHELRTPVAVVRSSLENLSLLPTSDAQKKYIERSQQGIQRLNKILTSMSEASRIEQSLQQGEKITVDLTQLMGSCLQGYEMIYTQSTFKSTLLNEPLLLHADPDFLVQLLDKIVHNAIEFSPTEEPIMITLIKQDNAAQNTAQLCITNMGPLLTNGNNHDLFQSMVSIRPSSQQHDAHLGLGLYIAKMICDYHQANITIKDNEHLTGVTVTITFPLLTVNT